jgi:hypothetical protein
MQLHQTTQVLYTDSTTDITPLGKHLAHTITSDNGKARKHIIYYLSQNLTPNVKGKLSAYPKLDCTQLNTNHNVETSSAIINCK